MFMQCRFKELRLQKGMTQEEFRLYFNQKYHRNYTPSAISRFENNKRIPETAALIDFADFFDVSVDYLLGVSDDKNTSTLQGQDGKNFLLFDGQQEPINHAHYKIPILGTVAAGAPIEAIEDVLGYEYLDDKYEGDGYQYFALKIRGDSMTPTIMDGDVVIVRKQSTVDSGQIAIVLVDGENATAKQVDVSPSGITVIGHNASVFAPRFIPNAETKSRLQIIGRVMECRRRFA
jgi:repressor LexA